MAYLEFSFYREEQILAKRPKAETWEEREARELQERIATPREPPPEGLKVWRKYSLVAESLRQQLLALSPEEKEGLSWKLLAPEHDFWIDTYDSKVQIVDEKRGEPVFIYCSFRRSWRLFDSMGILRLGTSMPWKAVSAAVKLAKTGSAELTPSEIAEKKARKIR